VPRKQRRHGRWCVPDNDKRCGGQAGETGGKSSLLSGPRAVKPAARVAGARLLWHAACVRATSIDPSTRHQMPRHQMPRDQMPRHQMPHKQNAPQANKDRCCRLVRRSGRLEQTEDGGRRWTRRCTRPWTRRWTRTRRWRRRWPRRREQRGWAMV